ncbi:MAG: phage major capsid domain-containing protein, partial [Candidatus Fonsibacter sp.]
LKVTTANRPAGTYAMNYGVTDALAPFPLHSLVNVMSATINNNTVSFNIQETLPLLLRVVDPEELAKFDCMTPTTLDFLADYDDALQPMYFFINPSSGAYGPHPPMYKAGDTNEEPDQAAFRMYGGRPQSWISYS